MLTLGYGLIAVGVAACPGAAGGIAELLEVVESTGTPRHVYVAAAVCGPMGLVTASAWYARRRWVR